MLNDSAIDLDLLRKTISPDLSDAELRLAGEICKRTQLDPFAKQIYFIKRAGRMTTQVSVDGLRLIAQRSGEYEGQRGPLWCGDDGVWKDVWLKKEAPSAAKVFIFRKGFRDGIESVALFSSYASKGQMWEKFGPLMIGKVAESLGLRRAFPQETSGIYSKEEFDSEDLIADTMTVKPMNAYEQKALATAHPVLAKLAAVADESGIEISELVPFNIDSAHHQKAFVEVLKKENLTSWWGKNKDRVKPKLISNPPNADNTSIALWLSEAEQWCKSEGHAGGAPGTTVDVNGEVHEAEAPAAERPHAES